MSVGITSGSTLYTADAIVGGIAGRPVRLFSAHWLSDGTARDLVLRNGSTASDTIWIQKAGATSLTQDFITHEEGILFPDGLFLDYTASTVNVILTYRVEV